MYKCNTCERLYDEPSAGLINHCGCEELTEEEHDKYRNRGEGNCPYFKCDGDCQNCIDAITEIRGEEEYVAGCKQDRPLTQKQLEIMFEAKGM